MITTHHVPGAEDSLVIDVKPHTSVQCGRYDITGFDTENNPAATDEKGYKASFSRMVVVFQTGPVPEVGQNGVTLESLLAVCAHRLATFQSGPFACPENGMALHHINQAMASLHARTLARVKREVKGTYEP